MCPTVQELPDGWRGKRLGSFCDKIGTGATPRGGSEVYLNSRAAHALVRSLHVFDRHFDMAGLAFISDSHATELRNAEVQSGDVLLNITGDGVTLGRCCIVPDRVLPACVNQHVCIIRPNVGECVPGYLLAVLTHPATKGYIESFNSGGSRRAITKGHIESFEIPLPPLAEQKAIASVLGALDDKIELNRRMNATLEAMARALFQSWFVDFDPVRARLGGRQPPGMDKSTAALFPAKSQESEAGHIPKGWEAQRLPDAIDVNPRRTLKSGAIAPYLDMKNLPTQGHSAEEVIDREFSSGTKFQNGDTLLARITPCLENGKTGYVDFLEEGQVGWGSTEYIVLSPKPPLPPQFGYLLARSGALRSHAIQNMTGTSGRQRVPSECFKDFWLAVPPPEIAHRFDELAAPLMAKIRANSTESRTLAALRDTLLPRLLSGELSVTACGRTDK
jgi:type I restriction enzyme S subunit